MKKVKKVRIIKSDGKGILETKIKTEFGNINFHKFRAKGFFKTDSLL